MIDYYDMYRINGRIKKVSNKCRKLFLKQKCTTFENELLKFVYDFKTFKNRKGVCRKLQKTIFLNRSQTRIGVLDVFRTFAFNKFLNVIDSIMILLERLRCPVGVRVKILVLRRWSPRYLFALYRVFGSAEIIVYIALL